MGEGGIFGETAVKIMVCVVLYHGWQSIFSRPFLWEESLEFLCFLYKLRLLGEPKSLEYLAVFLFLQ